MIQREAAQRFAGSPCSRETLSSLLLKPWWQIEIVRRFRRTDFDPPPSVDAVALWLARRTRPLVDRSQSVDYRRFIQSCFGRDGRSIRRCLRSEFTRTANLPAESRPQVRSFRTALRPHLRPVARIVQVLEADAIVSTDGASAHSPLNSPPASPGTSRTTPRCSRSWPSADSGVGSESHDAGSQSSIAFPSGSRMRAKRPMPSISLSWLTSISADFSCYVLSTMDCTICASGVSRIEPVSARRRCSKRS